MPGRPEDWLRSGGTSMNDDGLAAQAAAEAVEVVAADGSVIEVVTRAEMRAGNLRHRCTYVAVLAGQQPEDQPVTASGQFSVDPRTELWVHQRAPWKDTSPSYWDLAFGGVCGVGESWELSAQRELGEEAGITGVPLTDLGLCRYEDEQTKILGRAFVTWWPRELSCPDGEVVAVDRISLADLGSWLHSHRVCADSSQVFLSLLRP